MKKKDLNQYEFSFDASNIEINKSENKSHLVSLNNVIQFETKETKLVKQSEKVMLEHAESLDW